MSECLCDLLHLLLSDGRARLNKEIEEHNKLV